MILCLMVRFNFSLLCNYDNNTYHCYRCEDMLFPCSVSEAVRKIMGTWEVCRTFLQNSNPEPSGRETSRTRRSYFPSCHRFSASRTVRAMDGKGAFQHHTETPHEVKDGHTLLIAAGEGRPRPEDGDGQQEPREGAAVLLLHGNLLSIRVSPWDLFFASHGGIYF